MITLARLIKRSLTIGAAALFVILSAEKGYCGPVFYSTSNASQWQVATNVGGTDGLFSSFPTTGFVTATAITGRFTGSTQWIANNLTGSNGGNWTFFVFRQTFDLTGYDPAGVDLQFEWAADDSGQGYADRGTWVPKYSLNGGSLVTGSWPPNGETYSFGPVVDLSSGFVPGLNEIDFYVEGNGTTDGFALNPVSFTTTTPVPLPAAVWAGGAMLGSLCLGTFARRRRKTV